MTSIQDLHEGDLVLIQHEGWAQPIVGRASWSDRGHLLVGGVALVAWETYLRRVELVERAA